ncbi:hypothetical protein AC624_17410 [Bacillus sp. FJAT-27238]|nr:hypothetical protein AC624_17410 [Bacillus sp. FJAT-27238]
MKKRETASKVDDSVGFSEVDAKGSFSFFHGASVGVPKIFAVFSCFLCELLSFHLLLIKK